MARYRLVAEYSREFEADSAKQAAERVDYLLIGAGAYSVPDGHPDPKIRFKLRAIEPVDPVNPVDLFLADCTRREPGARVLSATMHALYCAWAKATASGELSARGLAFALKDRRYHSLKSNEIYWLDVLLTRQVSDFAPALADQVEG